MGLWPLWGPTEGPAGKTVARKVASRTIGFQEMIASLSEPIGPLRTRIYPVLTYTKPAVAVELCLVGRRVPAGQRDGWTVTGLVTPSLGASRRHRARHTAL